MFESSLRSTIARFERLIRVTFSDGASMERSRFRVMLEDFRDYDERGNVSLIDCILDEIGED